MRTATWYHASLKPIGRSTGRSAVACAAYRTGTSMADERYGTVRDFSQKADVVTHFTLAPEGAPAWATDAAQLWNAVEKRERKANANLAFEWEVALPNELDAVAREAIARRFGQWLVDEYGVAVTVGIHEGGTRGNGLNDHLHAMATTRALTADGWERTKLRDFNVRPGTPNPEVDRVRAEAESIINDALTSAGSDWRVDRRSYEARGIDCEPTKHLGPAGMARSRSADGSDRAEINRQILLDRLAWQMAQDTPDITPELDREFSQRWEGWEPLTRGIEANAGAELARGAEEAPALAHGAPAATDEEHTGWRRFVDRVRAFGAAAQAGVMKFLHDEASGAPEAERGFVARLFDAGIRLFVGISEGEGVELFEGIEQTAELAIDATAKPEGDTAGASGEDGEPPKSFAQRVRDEAVALWRNERGMVPDDDFDRMAAQWTPGPEPNEPSPPSHDAPEPDIPEPDGPDMT